MGNVDGANVLLELLLVEHLALKHKQFDKAAYLLAHGASMDIHDNSHTTPRQLNPGWARRMSVPAAPHAHASAATVTAATIRARATTLASQSPHADEINRKQRKSPLPKWVTSSNIQTNFGDADEVAEKLSRELTQLKDDVKSVKHFLEDFSDEGQKDNDDDKETTTNDTKRSVKSVDSLTEIFNSAKKN